MATPRSQRIGIWIIAIVLTVGTLGSFLVMVFSVKNQAIDEAQNKKLQAEYTKIVNEYQAKLDAQAKELSTTYFAEFSQYSSIPAVFKASDVKKLEKKDLKVGEGAEIKKDTKYSAYYIGWNPKGKIFDQSIKDGALISPLSSSSSKITGWEEGVIGMKIGGVRELTIPADKAYGKAGSGDDIPANTPLKFIIMAIPSPTEIPIPDMSKFQ